MRELFARRSKHQREFASRREDRFSVRVCCAFTTGANDERQVNVKQINRLFHNVPCFLLCNLCVLCLSVVRLDLSPQRRGDAQRKSLVIQNRRPTLVWIELFDGAEQVKGVLSTEVLLVNHAVMTHHKAFDAGNTVLCRKSNKREAANHCALYDEIHLTERRRRSLSFQYFEEIAMEQFSPPFE